jgi:hypothetical protein
LRRLRLHPPGENNGGMDCAPARHHGDELG